MSQAPGGWHTSTHAKGLVITASGVLVLTPDALFVRLLTVDPWTIMTWRGTGLAIGLGLVYWLGWARGNARADLAALGAPGLVGSVLFAADNVLFVTAITHTTVANTLLILSAGPLFAAVLSRLVLKERVPRRTWLAIAAVVGGVAVIFAGSLGQGRLPGDLAALGASLTIAGTFVVIRRSRARNMMPAMALGGLMAALFALPFAAPTSPRGPDLVLLLLIGLVFLPTAFGLITLGPRYIPAPEVSLLMLLETVLGPVWVWLVLHEVPPTQTFAGGAVVLTALAGNSLAALRGRRVSRNEASPLPGNERHFQP